MSATSVINSLLVLNEAALTIEQIAGMVARIRNGDVPTEDEIDLALARNDAFADSELERIGRAPD